MKLPNFSAMSSREKIMISIGIGVLLIVFADRFVVAPWWSYISKIRSETAKLDRLVVQQNQVIDRKDKVMEDVEAFKDMFREGKSPEIEMASFLREIEMLGRKSNVSLQEIRPLPSLSADLYQEYGLEVNYECNLKEFTNFVYLIETSPSLFVIERASLQIKEEGSDVLEGSLRIRRMALKKLV